MLPILYLPLVSCNLNGRSNKDLAMGIDNLLLQTFKIVFLQLGLAHSQYQFTSANLKGLFKGALAIVLINLLLESSKWTSIKFKIVTENGFAKVFQLQTVAYGGLSAISLFCKFLFILDEFSFNSASNSSYSIHFWLTRMFFFTELALWSVLNQFSQFRLNSNSTYLCGRYINPAPFKRRSNWVYWTPLSISASVLFSSKLAHFQRFQSLFSLRLINISVAYKLYTIFNSRIQGGYSARPQLWI